MKVRCHECNAQVGAVERDGSLVYESHRLRDPGFWCIASKRSVEPPARSTRDKVIHNALVEQLGKIRAKVDAARGRGSKCMVVSVAEAAFLVGLGFVLVEEIESSKPVADGQAEAQRERVSASEASAPDVVARAAPATGEGTAAIGFAFGEKAGR